MRETLETALRAPRCGHLCIRSACGEHVVTSFKMFIKKGGLLHTQIILYLAFPGAMGIQPNGAINKLHNYVIWLLVCFIYMSQKVKKCKIREVSKTQKM